MITHDRPPQDVLFVHVRDSPETALAPRVATRVPQEQFPWPSQQKRLSHLLPRHFQTDSLHSRASTRNATPLSTPTCLPWLHRLRLHPSRWSLLPRRPQKCRLVGALTRSSTVRLLRALALRECPWSHTLPLPHSSMIAQGCSMRAMQPVKTAARHLYLVGISMNLNVT
jgi:hypothetical protein